VSSSGIRSVCAAVSGLATAVTGGDVEAVDIVRAVMVTITVVHLLLWVVRWRFACDHGSSDEIGMVEAISQ
jgi:hypothetical protein